MTYHGQRGPNVSEFIANLNTIPAAPGGAMPEDNHFEDDLAMFTNTQFFDFDLGQDADLQPSQFRFEDIPTGPAPVSATDSKLDFDIQRDFAFTDFSFQQPADLPGNGMQRSPPAGAAVYPASSSASSPVGPSPHSGDKRKADVLGDGPSDLNAEEAARVAAEEDKRRRNTAASARFRVKKKQREQALEKSAKEMSDKVSALEGRINQLETENKWLKNLIIEKNGDKDDIADLWKKYNESAHERKNETRKDGVGTKA